MHCSHTVSWYQCFPWIQKICMLCAVYILYNTELICLLLKTTLRWSGRQAKSKAIGERTGESSSLSLSLTCLLYMACFHAHPSAQVNWASMKHYHRTDCVEKPATLSDQTVSRFYPQQNTFSTQDHGRKKNKS